MNSRNFNHMLLSFPTIHSHTHTHNYAVTLNGTNLLGHGGNITSVFFGDVAGTIDYSEVNDTVVRVRVQANDNTATEATLVRIIADTSAIVSSADPSIWTFLVEGEVVTNRPQQGQVGTEIVITGTNLLGGGEAISQILLDGVGGTVTNASDSSITITMDDLLTQQQPAFFPGEVYIVSDTGAMVTGGGYVHRASGTITSFSPTRGRKGTTITITGEDVLGFGTTLLGVEIDGVSCPVVSFNNSVVVIRGGMGSTNQTGPIVLRTDTGAVITSSTNFTFDEPGVVGSVSPTQGAEGTGVLVSGSGLLPSNVQLTSVTVGGVVVSRVVTASNQEVAIIVGPAPANNSESAAIVITASDDSFVDGIFFSFLNLSISLPGLSTGQEGTVIDISLPISPQFDPAAVSLRVTVDDTLAGILAASTTERTLSVSAPRARTQGTFPVDVAVEGANGVIARLRGGFTYLTEGVVYSVQPTTGQTGTRVTLEGENLLGGGSSVASATVVGQEVTVLRSNDTAVELRLLAGSGFVGPYPQLGDVVLMADTGAVVRRLGGFSLAAPGVIVQVSPREGQQGTRVGIVGTDLLQGGGELSITSVTLAGVVAAVITTPTDGGISLEAAASPVATQPGGVVITLSSGAVISSSGNVTFQYLAPGRINTVVQNIGAVGTRVAITGTDLLQGATNVSAVSLGGVPAAIDVTAVSNAVINVVAQAGTPGLGDVVIVADTGSTLTGTGLWTYEGLPTISAVSPATGQQGRRVSVSGPSLLGTGVSRFTTCTLAGMAADIVTFNSTNVCCRAGASPSPRMNVTGPVQLTTNTGVTLDGGNVTFTYYAAYIDSVSPASGNNGTEVTISGLNLFDSPGGSSFQVSRVLLGSVEATVVGSSADQVSVRVGVSGNATVGDNVRIESTSESYLVLAGAWGYTAPRRILSVDPRYGLPGNTVTLLGENLVPAGVTEAQVVVGQTEAFDVVLLNGSTVQFRVGVYQGSDLPEVDLPVHIVYPSSGETTASNTVVFRYNTTTETVASVAPAAGNEDSVVVISGTDLPNATNISRVTLAGVQATVVLASPTEITVRAGASLPEGASGQVLIETVDGRILGLTAEDAWEYYPVITRDDISPLTGQSGTVVNITLSRIPDLPAVTRVTLTGIPAEVRTVTDGVLMVLAGPSSTTPSGDVVVEFADGSSITVATSWSYQMPVTVSSVSPSSGYFNTLVTITGSGFQQGSAVTVTNVCLAGTETAIVSQSDSVLTVRVAAREENSSSSDLVGPITILADSGAYYSSDVQLLNFTHVGVRVAATTPTSGTRGTLVTLTGVGLLAGGTNIASVTIAGVSATVETATNSTQVSFRAGPSTSASNLSSIEYVMDTGATVRVPNSWRYIEPGQITSVSPAAGGLGTVVSISGSNLLGGGSRVVSVFLNSQETADILETFDNFVQVLAVGATGPLEPGSVRVVSDTGAVTESASPVEFAYLDPGTVSSVSPSVGQNGTRVTVLGQFLHNGEGVARVSIAGIEAAIVSVQDTATASNITVEAGRPMDSRSFQGPVLVQSNANTTTISAQNFTYLSEGVIFSVSPTRGRNGTVISIEGENLLGGGGQVQSVALAGGQAIIVNQSSSAVFVTAPLGPCLTGDILLVSDTNAHVRRVDGWTTVPAGTVDSVTPSEGQYGTRVTIDGASLLSGGSGIGTLTFGDVALDVVSTTDIEVVATIGQPADRLSFTSESITLTSDLRGVLYLQYNWTFLNQSAITSITPPDGVSSTDVTIRGTNLLGGGVSITSVSVAGIPAIVVSFSDDQVVITAGANTLGASRSGDLVLVSDSGALTSSSWTYNEECPAGMFGTASNCVSCSDDCERCVGPTEFDCTRCLDQSFSIFFGDNSTSLQCVDKCPGVSTLDNVCVDTCETDQYEQIDTLQNLTFCYDCNSLCDPNLGCSGPEPTQCNGCLFFIDVNQTCVESCPSDSFFVNRTEECIPCHPQCSGGCSGPLDSECDDCANLRINPGALSDAFGALPNDVCRQVCPSLFFQDADFCIPCDSSCSLGCSGPNPFHCDRCANVSFVYPNGTRKCLPSCNPDPASLEQYYYTDTDNVCQRCSELCLQGAGAGAGAGCTGPNATDCNACSLSQDSVCVSMCRDSTYFAQNATRTCERCDETCGNRGCTDNPSNCIGVGSLSAGSGTIAFVIIIVLILVAVIVVLVVVIVLRLKGSSISKYKFPTFVTTNGRDSEENNYSRKAQVQNIPLASIEEKKTMANPLFVENGNGDLEVGSGIDVLYSDAGTDENLLPEKNTEFSASQELYTDMDNISPASPPVAMEEMTSASQELYIDMEPAGTMPTLPPKPSEPETREEKKPAPPIPSKDLDSSDVKPPIPEKAEKPPPPPPEPEADVGGTELYIEMDGGVTEVFINAGAGSDDVYDDVQGLQDTELITDSTYEDTESALAEMEQYRKSFRSGSNKGLSAPSEPLIPERKSFGAKRMTSAPALPSQPIPKKRLSSGMPLPPTPFHKSASNSAFSGPASPTSTLSRPESIISNSSMVVPEEECLYDDIGAVQPLVNPVPAQSAKSQPQKKQPKQKAQKAKKK